MKKVFLFMFLLIIFPLTGHCATAMNLEEALKDENLSFDSSYLASEDAITIYLFRGKGCKYCKNFLEFLNRNVKEYGKYFKLVSYEVWNNSDNRTLMKEVREYLNQTSSSVPFIIIGDKFFKGYSEKRDEEILDAIVELYQSKNRFDIFEDMDKTVENNPVKKENEDIKDVFIEDNFYSNISNSKLSDDSSLKAFYNYIRGIKYNKNESDEASLKSLERFEKWILELKSRDDLNENEKQALEIYQKMENSESEEQEVLPVKNDYNYLGEIVALLITFGIGFLLGHILKKRIVVK